MKYIKEFFTLPLEEQQTALSHVATQKGLPLIVVEKDLWVTILLHILFGKNGSEGRRKISCGTKRDAYFF